MIPCFQVHPTSPSKRLAAWPSAPLAPTERLPCRELRGAALTMAALALAARLRLGVGAVKALQARGFGSDRSDRSDAGSIREAGGAFGKREQAEEERFFRARSREQLAALKKHHEDEITHHTKEVERLQKEIERYKEKIKKLKQHDDD
ncbi:hypothetical protein MC885_007902 [Smutsia gigantea]|nr:hypothetical protein MC885_007902 [Smutsia gigantea]